MWFYKKSKKLDEQLSEIKFAIRILNKQSEKAFKQQKSYVNKTKTSIINNDIERSELFAQQAIRHKHLSLRYLSMSLRMEIVESMVQSAITSGSITDGVSKVINTVCNLIDPQNMVNCIDKFEEVFDDLSISVDAVSNSLTKTVGMEYSESTNLLNKLKEEYGVLQYDNLPIIANKNVNIELDILKKKCL